MSSSLEAFASSAITRTSIGIAGLFVFFATVYVFTYLRFQLDLYRYKNATDKNSLQAPRLPIIIPWVGNAPSFLSTKPNKFWQELFSWYPHRLGAISMTLGGSTSTVLFDKEATSYIMKDRKLGREQFNLQVVEGGFGLSRKESGILYEYDVPAEEGRVPGHVELERINQEYLLKSEHVNEMTAEFLRFYEKSLFEEPTEAVVDINVWLRRLVFKASITALMGKKLLDLVPNFEELFFNFDQSMLSLFFGLPEFMISKQVKHREKALNALIGAYEVINSETGGQIADPDGSTNWEPHYGSRINRARQIYYQKKGLILRARAGLDLGEVFGIASNAVPASGWMLMHILDSKDTGKQRDKTQSLTLYEHIMDELRACQKQDGKIDISTLVNQPVLLSTMHEVLRLYVDTLVSRGLTHETSLPMSHLSSSTTNPTSSLKLKAGSLIMMPTYPSHTNPNTWEPGNFPSAQTFYPYRFLSHEPGSKSSEKPVFSSTPFNGSFFPFGGGKTMCPGRTFAKQEILASVALVLLRYELDVLGYVDKNGKATSQFPGLRDTLPGSAVFVASGDIKVKMKRRD